MPIHRLFRRVPSPGSPCSSKKPKVPHWLQRSGLGLLALFLAGPACLAVAPAGPEIAIEQPVGVVLGSEVVAWGKNDFSQTTVPAAAQSAVRGIAAGSYHTVALKSDGTVVAWGDNFRGQTTVPTGLMDVQSIAVGGSVTMALKTNGTVVAWGDNFFHQTEVPAGLTEVQAIATGGSHAVALKTDGSIVAWGSNSFGESDVPVGLSGVQAIAVGIVHTVALKADGTVVVWGSNFDGPTNVPAGLTGVKAIAAGSGHTVALKNDGTVVAWGRNVEGQVDVPAGLTGVQAIGAGFEHTVALKSDGTVVAWGTLRANFGQTRVPTVAKAGVLSIAAGGYHTVALMRPAVARLNAKVAFGEQSVARTNETKIFTIKNTGNAPLVVSSMSVTGGNAEDFTVLADAVPQSLPAISGQTTFNVVFAPTAAGLRETTLRVLSDDADETSYDIALSGTGVTAPEIAIEQPVGTPLDKTVVAWGSNAYGQTTVPAGLTDVQAVAAGENHTLALKRDGTVIAWGDNAWGQATVPTGLTEVRAIAGGTRHNVALKRDGTVVAWGYNLQGQTTVPAGLTGVRAVATRGIHSVALKSDGTVVEWGDNLFGQTLTPEGLIDVRAIAAGFGHTLALQNDGAVVAFGYNGQGQATVPAGLTDVRTVAAGYVHSLALKNDGTVVTWGGNDPGQTAVPIGLTNVQALAAGYSHTVALKTDGKVVAWGQNLFGETKVPAGLQGVHAISAGGYHTVALANPVIAFGSQISGTTSEARTFKIKNTGNAALHLASVSLLGGEADDFTVDAAAVPATLAEATGETTFTVAFTPHGSGVKSATLRVISDDAEEPIYNIPLTGTALFRDTGFTTDKQAIDLDVLANDPGVSRITAVFTFPAPPQSGTVRIVGGKIRYLPTGALPLAGDTFTYHFDDGHGGTGTGTVTITNFAAIAGEYDGLINAAVPQVFAVGVPADAPARHRQSGYLHLSLTKTGAFSGALTFGGTKLNPVGQTNSLQYSFMGRLGRTGNTLRLIERRGLPPIALAISFDAETQTISGTAESLDGTAPFISALALAKRTAAGPLAGTYSVEIVGDGTLGAPEKRGIANVRLGAGGNVILVGKAGDGTAFSTSAFLHADQTFPLYAVLYRGSAATRGSLRGIVPFPGSILNPGTLEWFKPARAGDPLFPNGFGLSAEVLFPSLIK